MNVPAVVLVLFLYQRFAHSYHFQDVHFNSFLMSEWEDMHAADTLSRYPRAIYQSTHSKSRSEVIQCSRHIQAACCGGEHIFNMQTSVKDTNKMCLLKVTNSPHYDEEKEQIDYFNCSQVLELKRRTTCIKQCVGMELKILGADGNLLDDPLNKFMMSTVSSESWKRKLAQDAITTCIQNNKSKFERIKEEMSLEGDCNPAALDFLYCTWAETQLKCPNNRRVSGKHCDAVRKKLEKYTKINV